MNPPSFRTLLWILAAFSFRSQAFQPKLKKNSDALSIRTTTRLGYQNDTSENWINRSVEYYSKIMREERRRSIGQAKHYDTEEYQRDFLNLAKRHYFALRKIKDGRWDHAETIYRKTIDEILGDGDEDCDHAKLAVTTLLLALHTQRSNDVIKTRSVFLNFFRVAMASQEECACTAKVLQAYALFELRQGHSRKSFQIIQKAVEKDRTLSPVLKWKQFRDVQEQIGLSP